MRKDAYLGVRIPEIYLVVIKTLGLNISDFVREAILEKLIEYCGTNDDIVTTVRLTLEEEIRKLELVLEEKKLLLKRLDESVSEFRKLVDKIDSIINNYFKDIDNLDKDAILARIDAIAEEYGYPKSFVLKKLIEKYPRVKEVIEGGY